MKRTMLPLIAICFSLLAHTASVNAENRFSVGVRRHADHSVYTELPFDDGDLSYGIAYEIHEEQAYWQLAVEYAPDISGTNPVDFAVTPQLNLLFKDRCWLGGLGVLTSYVAGDDGDEWTDLYWQFIFGLQLGTSRKPEIDVLAYYPFENWSDIGDFDAQDIEFGLWLCFPL